MTECGSSCYAEQSAAWRAVCASSYYLVLPVLHILDGTLRRVLVGEGDKGKPLVLLGVLVLGQPHLPSNLIINLQLLQPNLKSEKIKNKK